MQKKLFDKYRNEFSRMETTNERRHELIGLMRENIRKRCEGRISFNIEGQVYSIDSDKVEHLYAIDGFLKQEGSRKEMSAVAETERQRAHEKNKYGPTHPYPNK